jgi:hypothetical protein
MRNEKVTVNPPVLIPHCIHHRALLSGLTLEPMDQQKLVKDCLKGKLQAQKELYEHFAEKMLGVCYRYTRSMRDAEDVLQEGFVKV